ncbi:MAG: glycosyltransferase family 2 protein [Kordiimonas sp.]
MGQPPVSPNVTVVVCAYKIGERIRPTIEAILGQSYSSLRLLVIDDASGDNTVDVVNSFDDERLTLVENDQNLGIIDARNKGLALADTEFIATCDHDDVWLPNKLEKQLAYMEQHQDCGLVGTYWTVYVNGKVDGVRTLPHIEPNYLKWSLFHRNCLLHSSLLMRAAYIKKYKIAYRDGLRFADDWKLCFDFARNCEIGIIPESLVSYYIHGENWSVTARDNMLGSGVALFQQELPALLDRDVLEEEIRTFFYSVAGGTAISDNKTLRMVGGTLQDIAEANIAGGACRKVEKGYIEETASEIWWRVVRTSAGTYGPARLKLYKSPATPNTLKISTFEYCTEWLKACVKTLVSNIRN